MRPYSRRKGQTPEHSLSPCRWERAIRCGPLPPATSSSVQRVGVGLNLGETQHAGHRPGDRGPARRGERPPPGSSLLCQHSRTAAPRRCRRLCLVTSASLVNLPPVTSCDPCSRRPGQRRYHPLTFVTLQRFPITTHPGRDLAPRPGNSISIKCLNSLSQFPRLPAGRRPDSVGIPATPDVRPRLRPAGSSRARKAPR
jgi:hypothetical protein